MHTLTNQVVSVHGAIAATEKNKNPNYSVDWEGLFSDDRIKQFTNTESRSRLCRSKKEVTVIHIFPSEQAAKIAVVEMQRQGLSPNQIEIIAKNYIALNDALKWDRIAMTVGWSGIMEALGISEEASWEFVDAVENGKYLVLAIIGDREASQAQHILKNIGHWVIAVH
jgi:hypothetical protein